MPFNIKYKTYSFTISIQSDNEFLEVVKNKVYNKNYQLFFSKDGKNVSIRFLRTIKQDNKIYIVDKMINTYVVNLAIKDFNRSMHGSDDFEYSYANHYLQGIWYKMNSDCDDT